MLDDRRRELLAAIGIELYCLRVKPGSVEAAPVDATTPPRVEELPGAAGPVRLAIAVPGRARRDARLAPLLAQLVRALGVGASEVDWIETDGDRVAAPLPEVSCYLMIGAAAARACSVQLSLERQSRATIAVSADPDALFRDGAGRRALWQGVKPLVQRLRSG